MPEPTDAATLQAFGEGVQAALDASDREWGAGRLPMLVSDELRVRYRRQETHWSEAYRQAWVAHRVTLKHLDDVELHAGAMKRALDALHRAAVEAGHRPIAPWVWEAVLGDGSVCAVVQTNAEAGKVIAEGRHVHVYTLAEVAAIIDALPAALRVAKVVFPGAQLVRQMDRGWVKEGDEIPF